MGRYASPNNFGFNSNYSSADSSTNNQDLEYINESNFNYDSEDAECNNLVGQALHYCEATRGGKKRQFNNAEERFQFRQQYEAKKKTELCRNFEMYGNCRYGDTCSYAHGIHQLQKKTHLPSNFMTKLCHQYHETGICAYGERCQYLHSIYDLKTELSYCQALKEGARLTQQRNKQICGDTYADCLWANLKTGDGCGAPKKPRLPVFEQIYNKDNYQPQLHEEKYEDHVAKANSSPQQEMASPYFKQQNAFQPLQYQPAMMKSQSYNYNNNMNMGYNNQYTQQNQQFYNYQNQMYNNNYNQQHMQYPQQTCKQQAFSPQDNAVNQKFNSFWQPIQNA